MRNKNAHILWVVNHHNDIRDIVRMFEGSSIKHEYRASQRILTFAGIEIRFILATDDGERLCGTIIDEVIINESD